MTCHHAPMWSVLCHLWRRPLHFQPASLLGEILGNLSYEPYGNANLSDWAQKYKMGKILGEGDFGDPLT